MDDLFLLIFLVSIVAVAVFIFKGFKNGWKFYKKKVFISLGVMVASFILFGLTVDSEEVAQKQEEMELAEQQEAEEKERLEKEKAEKEQKEKEQEEKEQEVETEDPKEPELTTEEQIEQLANEHLGQVDDFRYVEGVEEGTEYISVNAQISDNLTTNMTRKGFIMNIKNFVESIKNESFGEVYVGGYADMVDQYGNESNYEVISFSMLKETVDKINFDNISIENFENVADNINVHPALQE